jgi:predicted RNase H-like nuclease (RuvC/YqgF family)
MEKDFEKKIKKIVSEGSVDYSIGPELGSNPTKQEIAKALEKRKFRLAELESQNSELEKLISENKVTIERYQLQIHRLEKALEGEPLYKKSYLDFKTKHGLH